MSDDESFGQRQCGSCLTMLLGFALVPFTVYYIFDVENDAVAKYETAELVHDAKSVIACNPSAADTNKLVRADCDVNAPDLSAKLPDFLRPWVPSFKGSTISWDKEIYAWSEHQEQKCKTVGKVKHCKTEYTCVREWSKFTPDSDLFRCSGSHSNRKYQMPSNLRDDIKFAPEYSVLLGKKFYLDSNLQQQIPNKDLYELLTKFTNKVGSFEKYSSGTEGRALKATNLVTDNGYLQTFKGTSPSLGDIRIKVKGRFTQTATAVGKQVRYRDGYEFKMWPPQEFGWFGKKTKWLKKLLPGKLDANEFVAQWKTEISIETWYWRLGCFIVMVIAFHMIFAPLFVAADMLRMCDCLCCMCGSLLDDIATCFLSLIAFSLACVVYLFAVAVAWLVARPLIGLVFLAGGVLLLSGALMCCKKCKSGKGARDTRFSTASSVDGFEMTAPSTAGGVAFAPGQMVMQVQCPINGGPGTVLQVTAPDGHVFQATVPAGVIPGSMFQVMLPV